MLIDCDATVVGYLDAVREIVRERDYHHFQEAEADLRSIWVNEEKGFCPFWALMTAQERVSVLSELDHAVSVVEHLTGSVKAGQGQERLVRLLRFCLNHTLMPCFDCSTPSCTPFGSKVWNSGSARRALKW